jgi:hypothetical protein
MNKKLNNAVDVHGNRRGNFTPRTFNQFQVLEEKNKKQYLQHVENKDKKAQSKAIKDQDFRSVSLKNWKELLGDSYQMLTDNLYSKALSPRNSHILSELHSQKNTSIGVDPETQEMFFLIPKMGVEGEVVMGQDGDALVAEKLDTESPFKQYKPDTRQSKVIRPIEVSEEGSRRWRSGMIKVKASDLNTMMNDNLKPINFKVKFGTSLNNSYKEGRNNGNFDYKRIYSRNMDMVNEFAGGNKNKMNCMYTDDCFGNSVQLRQEIKRHPDFANITYDQLGVDIPKADKKQKTEKDTTIKGVDIMSKASVRAKKAIREYRGIKLSETDLDLLVNNMLDTNPELAAHYAATYATDLALAEFNKGLKKSQQNENNDYGDLG